MSIKTVLVTGATRGLGKSIALELAKAGLTVAVTGRTLGAGQGRHHMAPGMHVPGSVEETVAEIAAAGGSAFGLRLDLLDRASIDAALAEVMARCGRLDVLVNNGIYQGPVIMQHVREISMADAEDCVRGNFINQLYLSQKALEIMIAQGGGRMIFMSTHSSAIPAAGASGLMYNASKAAFNKIPDYINFEHGKDGIAAFLIEPRFTMTDTLRAVLGGKADEIGKGSAARDPVETARTVVWLARHENAPRFAGPEMMNAPDFFKENGITPD